jgi:hypothetical protein
MARRPTTAIPLFLALLACDARPTVTERTAATVTLTEARAPTRPLACAATREVDGADVVVLRDERLYYLNGQSGLLVFDVSAPSAPAPVGRAPLVGTPMSLIVREAMAVGVMAEWDEPHGEFRGSIARAFDIRTDRPAPMGEVRLEGITRDARAVDDVLYVLHESRTDVILTSIGMEGGLTTLGERRFAGSHATLTASPTLLALAYRPAEGGTRVVTFDLGLTASGDLAASHTVAVRGAIPAASRDIGAIAALDVDADADSVRVLTCATDCGAADGLFVSKVDLSGAGGPRVIEETPLDPPEGSLVARWGARHLYVTGTRRAGDPRPTTSLRILDLSTPTSRPRILRVDGRIANLVPFGERLLAIGGPADPRSSLNVVLYEIDPTVPRVVGKITLGDAMTSTPAQRDVRAVATYEGTIALPITSWKDGALPAHGVAVLRGGHPPSVQLGAPGWIDRVAFVGGQLIALGAFGARSVEPSATPRTFERP